MIHAIEKKQTIYMKDVYHKIIYFALAAHFLYVFVSYAADQEGLMVYNIGSTLFYVLMHYLVKQNGLRMAVTMIHSEVCLFVCISTVLTGWPSGFPMYLIALSSLVYFCPYRNKLIPYLISLLEVLAFFLLKLYMDHSGITHALASSTQDFLYLGNSLGSFSIIIYAAYISKVSATRIEKSLADENESLQELANYDQLTGLWTRWHLFDSLKNKAMTPYYAVIGDIDDFKLVNDTYGHKCGDEVLVGIATMMKIALYQDTAIVRWGGEEFVMLFEYTDKEAVIQELEALRKQIEEKEFTYEGHSFQVTMTFGVASCGEDIEEAIQKADVQLYKGKQNGKNRIMQQ